MGILLGHTADAPSPRKLRYFAPISNSAKHLDRIGRKLDRSSHLPNKTKSTPQQILRFGVKESKLGSQNLDKRQILSRSRESIKRPRRIHTLRPAPRVRISDRYRPNRNSNTNSKHKILESRHKPSRKIWVAPSLKPPYFQRLDIRNFHNRLYADSTNFCVYHFYIQ